MDFKGFGNPDIADAIGEFTGAGPSIIADLIYAFGTDADFDDKAATIRRIIPLNTLWIWDRTFKNLYNNMGADVVASGFITVLTVLSREAAAKAAAEATT